MKLLFKEHMGLAMEILTIVASLIQKSIVNHLENEFNRFTLMKITPTFSIYKKV